MNTEIIKKYYEDPVMGFVSSAKLFPKIKKDYPKIKRKEVDEFIKNQSTHQIHTHQKIKQEDFNTITANGFGFFQIDLIDLSNYKSKNKNSRFILIAVDIKSRYSYLEPLKSKTSQEVYDSFMNIYKQVEKDKHRIYAIYSDKGKEFSMIKKQIDELNIKWFMKEKDNHRGTGIVDRRVRTFRELLEKYFTSKNTLNWIDVYDKININMNTNINRTIGETPNDVWNGKEVSKQVINDNRPIDKFEIGNMVRIKNDTNNFSKNTTGLFSNQVYRIEKIDGLGFFCSGLSRKLFPADVKRVNDDVAINTTDELRKLNKKKNTIKKRLRKELF